jgi:hypothetical protein
MTVNYVLKGRGRRRRFKVIFLHFLAVTEKMLRLRVFENRLLRRIFGTKREELRGEWRKLHNEELNYLHSLPNIIRVKNEVCWPCSMYGGEESCLQGFGGEI